MRFFCCTGSSDEEREENRPLLKNKSFTGSINNSETGNSNNQGSNTDSDKTNVGNNEKINQTHSEPIEIAGQVNSNNRNATKDLNQAPGFHENDVDQNLKQVNSNSGADNSNTNDFNTNAGSVIEENNQNLDSRPTTPVNRILNTQVFEITPMKSESDFNSDTSSINSPTYPKNNSNQSFLNTSTENRTGLFSITPVKNGSNLNSETSSISSPPRQKDRRNQSLLDTSIENRTGFFSITPARTDDGRTISEISSIASLNFESDAD